MAERRRWRRRALDRVEGIGATMLFGIFGLLPLDAASALGGFLARTIGPHLGISKRARLNLERALPELDHSTRRAAIIGMWDNIGRVLAEFPHLRRIPFDPGNGRTTIEGYRHIAELRAGRQSAIFVSGHFGNWELAVLSGARNGLEIARIYRAINNPMVDRLINGARSVPGADELLPKGGHGARRAIAALRQGTHLGLLADQKMNDGIAVPFFGRDAMTAPALARLALRYRSPVLPARVERVGGAHFRVVIEPPLPLPDTGDPQADALTLMRRVNETLEGWIRARPEQWLWLHKRWPD